MYGNDTFVTHWDQKTKYLLGRWNETFVPVKPD